MVLIGILLLCVFGTTRFLIYHQFFRVYYTMHYNG